MKSVVLELPDELIATYESNKTQSENLVRSFLEQRKTADAEAWWTESDRRVLEHQHSNGVTEAEMEALLKQICDDD